MIFYQGFRNNKICTCVRNQRDNAENEEEEEIDDENEGQNDAQNIKIVKMFQII